VGQVLTNQYPREDYYVGMQIDCRNIFINYGHWLEKQGIENEGDISDYETFLKKWNEEKELQRDLEYSDLMAFIRENEFDNLNLYKQEDYYDEEYDKVTCIYGEEFFDIIGIKEKKFRNLFVKSEYISEYEDRMNIVIETNGGRQGYILEVS